ncbi:hypothetical protein BH09PLA1_BH09PLA1_18510 [soil metagenome]
MRICNHAALAAALFFPHPAFAQTQPTTSPQNEQAFERAKLEAQDASLPRVQVKSIKDVIRFSRQQSQLLAKSQLADLKQETRISAPDAPGSIKMRPFVLSITPDGEAPGFSYIQNDLTGPAPFQSITTVSLAAGKLTIARDTQHGTVTESVQLLQDPVSPSGDPDSPTISLYLSRQDDSGTSQSYSVKRTASSFDDLCIRYPDDVNEHLRPVFRDFKQEAAVLAPDPAVAWQVLASDYTIDPVTLERVNALVTRLDADSYEDRQTALAGLREIGQPAANILMRAERAAMSPEKQSGVDTLLAPYVRLTVDEVKSLRDNPTFLLDALTIDDLELRKLAWQRLQPMLKSDVRFDPGDDDAHRNAAIDKLRALQKKP